MPAKKKKNIRRRERRHVLDVKLCARQTRVRRVRMLSSALLVTLLVLGIGVGCWLGGRHLIARYVMQNPKFAVRQVDVQTDGHLRVDYLRKVARLGSDDNLFAVDLETVRRDLEAHSQIRGVEISRELPGTVRIRVRERRPVFTVAQNYLDVEGRLHSRTFAIDPEGHVFRLEASMVEPAAAARWPNLPRLIGVDADELQPGARLSSESVSAALRLAESYRRSSVSRVTRLAMVRVGDGDTLRLINDDGAEIILGFSNHDRQLGRLRSILQDSFNRNLRLEWADLSVTNNIPTRLQPRFAGAAAITPAR